MKNKKILIIGIIIGIIFLIIFIYNKNYNILNPIIEEEFILDPSEKIIIKEEQKDVFSNINEFHWGEMPITYKIIGGEERQRKLIHEAFETISNETDEIIKFKGVNENPDISIYFKSPNTYDSNDELTLADSLPKFDPEKENLIISAEINIYGQGQVCKTGYPDLEVHEILHAFGFDDIPIMDRIMSRYSYSTSDCEIEKIDDDYISCLKKIYSNGEIDGDCSKISFNSFLEFGFEFEDICGEGWYDVEGTEFCCPEPDMIIIDDYCY